MGGRRSRFNQSSGGRSEKAADQFSAFDSVRLASHPCFLPQIGKIPSVSKGRPKNLSFYVGRDSGSLGPRSAWAPLESFMRNSAEKLHHISSVSTRLLCHRWPQINCQESGSEQMWPTPNWLHQHSVCRVSLSHSLSLSLPLSLCVFLAHV